MIPTHAAAASILAILICALAAPTAAQPFEAGPPGTVVGSSMANLPLAGRPSLGTPTIPNARVFGDTVEERVWGRDFDDSHLTPEVRRAPSAPPIALRAYEGRSELDAARAEAFARSGPTAIGRSSVTRPNLGARRLR